MTLNLTKCMNLSKPLRCLEYVKRCRLTFCTKNEDNARQTGKVNSTREEEFDDSSENYIEIQIPEPKYVNVNTKKKFLETLKEDAKQTLKFIKNPLQETLDKPFIPHDCDVIIFGAGPVGSTLANELKERMPHDMGVMVIDTDLSPDRFVKSDAPYMVAPQMTLGHVTQQFSLKENILLARNSVDYFRNSELHLDVFDDDTPTISYRPFGHLSLATDKGHIMLKENHIQQSKYGIHTELTTAYQLSQRFPWLNLDDISLGCLGTLNEGLIDPFEYMLAIRSAAMRRGVIFLEATPLEFHFRSINSHVSGYDPGTYQSPHSVVLKKSDGTLREIDFGFAVIAMGSETGRFMKKFFYLNKNNGGMFKLEVPITRKKHYVFCFESELTGPGFSSPMVKDPSGVYFRRDGYTNQYICGCTLPTEDPSADELHVDSKIFSDYIWPVLAHRVPAFEKLQLKSGWAYFEDHNSFDGSPIVGIHPAFLNVMLAAGFGRYSFLYAPGIAKALGEHLCTSYYSNLDLTRFGYNRIVQEEPLVEPLII